MQSRTLNKCQYIGNGTRQIHHGLYDSAAYLPATLRIDIKFGIYDYVRVFYQWPWESFQQFWRFLDPTYRENNTCSLTLLRSCLYVASWARPVCDSLVLCSPTAHFVTDHFYHHDLWPKIITSCTTVSLKTGLPNLNFVFELQTGSLTI